MSGSSDFAIVLTDAPDPGDTAVVQSRVLTKKGSEAPVEARMLKRNDKWYIYDVIIENVSLISNYRAQFDKIIRTSSYGELVRRLKERRAMPSPLATAYSIGPVSSGNSARVATHCCHSAAVSRRGSRR